MAGETDATRRNPSEPDPAHEPWVASADGFDDSDSSRPRPAKSAEIEVVDLRQSIAAIAPAQRRRNPVRRLRRNLREGRIARASRRDAARGVPLATKVRLARQRRERARRRAVATGRRPGVASGTIWVVVFLATVAVVAVVFVLTG